MKVNDILNEGRGGLSRVDYTTISGIDTDKLHELLSYFEKASLLDLPKSEYIHLVKDYGFKYDPGKHDIEEYFDEIWEEVENELERRSDFHEDENFDDLRDYEEEDRQAAWQDKYDMYKNEY